MRNIPFKRGMRRLAAVLATVGVGLAAQAQTQMAPYRPGVTTDGAVYFLPRTALRVSVLVEKTTYDPGEFAPYAQRYLRLADVPQEPSTAFRVVGLSVSAMPEPDTTKVYAVKFDARTVAARMTLTDDGRLLGLNVDDARDVEAPAPFVAAPHPALPDPHQYLSEEILACGSKAKMAELTAHEIADLRENRSLLVKGQADFMPQDGRQMQLMLDELDRQNRALTSLFQGVERADTTEHVLWVRPDGAFGRRVLFRLSQVHGLVEADDLSGAPFYVSVDDITQLPAPDTNAKKQKQEQGIYVNVPGRLRVTLYDGIDPVLTSEQPAAQLGQTLLLSANLFNKHYATRLWLDALTGSVQRLDADQPR